MVIKKQKLMTYRHTNYSMDGELTQPLDLCNFVHMPKMSLNTLITGTPRAQPVIGEWPDSLSL